MNNLININCIIKEDPIITSKKFVIILIIPSQENKLF